MSTYAVAIKLGTINTTILSTDVFDPLDTIYWLDQLRIGWATQVGDVQPVHPGIPTGSLTLLTKDVANVGANVEIGTTAQIRITGSGGVLVAAIAGRVADSKARVVRRGNVQWIAFDLIIADYVVDLAETFVSFTTGAGSNVSQILEAIRAASVAGGGPTLTGDVLIGGGVYDAYAVKGVSAFDAIDDVLRQEDSSSPGISVGFVDIVARPIMTSKTTAGVLTSINLDNSTPSRVAVTWPPAEFAVVSNLLTLVFGQTPPAALLGFKMGLRVETSDVLEDISYTQSKSLAANTVIMTNAGWGSVTVTNRSAGEPAITVTIPVTVNSFGNALNFIGTYLPDVDGNRWRVESFTWRPDDADIAALPFCLTPDSETGDATCYRAQVAVTGIANKINPSGNSGFYAGTLDAAAVTVTSGRLDVELVINHRLPVSAPGLELGISWDELEAQVGTGVKISVGAQKVDPNLSYYETRLARKA